MAGVMKIINNFKTNHMHGGKRSHAATITVAPAKDPTREDPEGALPTDLMHRRRVSISKSGRYRENHKKRSALLDDARSPVDTPSPAESDKHGVVFRDKTEKNRENEKNKENEQKQLNSSRRESAISVIDGHAVADEIESLARTIENGTKADLALT
ncbi:uncharacterized protein [Procambarus clarkii]|uniref:uncharacterized protein n=1 Tax=Procambarus clarkii TaxID=6728 RepID=UPI001E672047|nr:uncharacterized protein LOC123759048 [Procambarus clarkii]